MKHTKSTRKGPPTREQVMNARRTAGAPTSAPQAPDPKGAGRPRKTFDLAHYDSMEQMAAIRGIPVEILKEAKRSGCPFVRHDRCDLDQFIRWYFSTSLSAEERENWTRRDKRASAIGKEISNDHKMKRLIDRDFVQRGVADVVGAFSSELDRLSQELPSILDGLNKVQIRDAVREQKDKIRRLFDSKMEKFKKESNEP